MSHPHAQSVLRINIAAAGHVLESLASLEHDLHRAANLVSQCLLSGGKLIVCGNGGSAADAQHLATEFVVRYRDDRPPYPAIALTESGPTLTAIGNDYDFDESFARQVRAFGKSEDVLIALTTSGQSRNIIKAIEAAREIGMRSIAFLGKGGGLTRGLATVDLVVDAAVTARIQEAHALLYHTLCEMIEPSLAGLPDQPR